MEIEKAVEILKYELDEMILIAKSFGNYTHGNETIQAIEALLGFYYSTLKKKSNV
jgi:hypothetical protein